MHFRAPQIPYKNGPSGIYCKHRCLVTSFWSYQADMERGTLEETALTLGCVFMCEQVLLTP